MESTTAHGDASPFVEIRGNGLTLAQAYSVAHVGVRVSITGDPQVTARVHDSYQIIQDAVNAGEVIYGVNTGFGGMADVILSTTHTEQLQRNMLWAHKAGAGANLPVKDVRAAMLLRANSHLRGASGIRMSLIQRIEIFLNEGVTPHVPELGSIGASGDLVPLSYIAGCLIGHEANYLVAHKGVTMPARQALAHLGLAPLELKPKEALAMLNGTSMMTGIAANCVAEARELVSLSLHIHALMFQGLHATSLSLHPFIHQSKPHQGQVRVAEIMSSLLDGSAMVRDSQGGSDRNSPSGLVQDRYSLRCLPQYLGPVMDGLKRLTAEIEVEMNSTNDNPIVDPDTRAIYYGGNFLGEYVGVGMDHLRYLIGLVAKHLDVQIAMLVEPAFSNGLSPSLVGNTERRFNMGLKPLQIVGNSIMPLIGFLGNSLADRYPTHAEQFNQNVNSQGFGSANLARQQISLFRQYLSIALIFGVQSVDLRSHEMYGTYNARPYLSPASRTLYDAFKKLTQRNAEGDRPWLWNDDEQELDEQVARIAADLASQSSGIRTALGSPAWD